MAIDVRRIGTIHVSLLVAVGCLAYATQWLEPRSVLLGGAVMGVNFWLLHLIARALGRNGDTAAAPRRAALAVAAFAVKLALLIAVAAALFWRLPVEGMSFALGVTLLLVACVAEAARAEWFTMKGVG